MKRSAVLKGMVDGAKKEIQKNLAIAKNADESYFTMHEKDSSKDIDPCQTFKEIKISPESLGSEIFKSRYKLKYAYVAGSMFRSIGSVELVVKMGNAGMLGFFGAGGLPLIKIEDAIHSIQKKLSNREPYGLNLLHTPNNPEMEEEIVDLYLKNGVTIVEASAYLLITPAIVKYHAKGLIQDESGRIISLNRIIAKVSRPEIAESFLSPAPENILNKLFYENKISAEEFELSKKIPVCDDITIEADSGGHTDGGVAYVLMPAMVKLRDRLVKKYGFVNKPCIGAAGGIGTPEAAAAAFIMGADYIVTGSINQCTVEATTSIITKNLLQQMNVQDTDYAPAGDMLEMGAKMQVLKKGLFFPARANKLYELYRQFNSLDEIDEKTKKQLQEKYFKRDFENIYIECKEYFTTKGTNEIERAEKNPKIKMSLIFKWYFNHSINLALVGKEEDKVDFQIPCGPALGGFNQWVKETELENWANRHVDEIGIKILNETAEILAFRYSSFIK